MKKIILTSMLAISFMTATATQLSENVLNSLNDTISTKEIKIALNELDSIEVVEEQDEPFDFNIKDYLPIGFNPNKSIEEKYNIIYEVSIEEADEPFDFNTEDYLPVGFRLNTEIIKSIKEIAIVEKDEKFDFDTKSYLPKGFNPYKKVEITNEL